MLRLTFDKSCMCVHVDRGAPLTRVYSLRLTAATDGDQNTLWCVQHVLCTVRVCASEKRYDLFPCVCLADVVLCLYMLRRQQFRETLPVVLKGR